MTRRSPYKMHAYGAPETTLCGLTLNQPHGRLPLAKWPTGITCQNCLALWYSGYLREDKIREELANDPHCYD